MNSIVRTKTVASVVAILALIGCTLPDRVQDAESLLATPAKNTSTVHSLFKLPTVTSPSPSSLNFSSEPPALDWKNAPARTTRREAVVALPPVSNKTLDSISDSIGFETERTEVRSPEVRKLPAIAPQRTPVAQDLDSKARVAKTPAARQPVSQPPTGKAATAKTTTATPQAHKPPAVKRNVPQSDLRFAEPKSLTFVATPTTSAADRPKEAKVEIEPLAPSKRESGQVATGGKRGPQKQKQVSPSSKSRVDKAPSLADASRRSTELPPIVKLPPVTKELSKTKPKPDTNVPTEQAATLADAKKTPQAPIAAKPRPALAPAAKPATPSLAARSKKSPEQPEAPASTEDPAAKNVSEPIWLAEVMGPPRLSPQQPVRDTQPLVSPSPGAAHWRFPEQTAMKFKTLDAGQAKPSTAVPPGPPASQPVARGDELGKTDSGNHEPGQTLQDRSAAAAPTRLAKNAPSSPTWTTARMMATTVPTKSKTTVPTKSKVGPSTNTAPRPTQRPRSRGMDLVANRAGEHIRYAFDLAERRAIHSSRAEFISAVTLVAQGLDAEQKTTRHHEALVAGLRALREAEDFAPRDARLSIDIDLKHLSAAHQTPILRDAEASQLNPFSAMQAYYEFAKKKLSEAGEREPAASLAIYGLARIESVASKQQGNPGAKLAGPKAIALHQTALAIDANNYRAANELGVLLGRFGQWEAAQKAILQGLSTYDHPASWNNLAYVHDKLGQPALASEARRKAKSLFKRRPVSQQVPVRWVNASTLAAEATADGMQMKPVERAGLITDHPARIPGSQANTPAASAGGISQLLPWSQSTSAAHRKGVQGNSPRPPQRQASRKGLLNLW